MKVKIAQIQAHVYEEKETFLPEVYRKKMRKGMYTIPLMSWTHRAIRLRNTEKCICLISP